MTEQFDIQQFLSEARFSSTSKINAKQAIEYIEDVEHNLQDIQNDLEEVEYVDGFIMDIKDALKADNPVDAIDDLERDLDDHITAFSMIEDAAKLAQTNLEKVQKFITAIKKEAEKLEEK